MTHATAIPPRLAHSLSTAAAIVNDPAPVRAAGPLRLGIDLGTSDVVAMALDEANTPVAVCLEWADVVRDGVVFNFYGAAAIVKKQLAALRARLGTEFTSAATSYPPGTDPRIAVNVIEAAGLNVAAVIDEPSAVARLLDLDAAVVVDIGGGTTGIAVLQNGRVVYSGDEPTGGHHVTLTIAGNRSIPLEEAERLKIAEGGEVWPIVRPVFEKMADIVRRHLAGYQAEHLAEHRAGALYLCGGSCALPGVFDLFRREFPDRTVVLPDHPLFLTPLAVAAYRPEEKG